MEIKGIDRMYQRVLFAMSLVLIVLEPLSGHEESVLETGSSPEIILPERSLLKNEFNKSEVLTNFNRVTHLSSELISNRVSFERLLLLLNSSVYFYRETLKKNSRYDHDVFIRFQTYLGLALNKWLGPDMYKRFSQWATFTLREKGRKVPNYLMIIPPERSPKHRFER